MARTPALYNARFSVDGASWWDKTTDGTTWASVAALTGQAPTIPDPAELRSVYRNLVAVTNNVMYWVGTVAGIQTLFSFDGTTQTVLSSFPDQGGGPATDCNSVCEHNGNICILMGYGSGDYIAYRWDPTTSTLTEFGGASVIDPGTGGHFCSALGLLWMIQSPSDPGKLYRVDPLTGASWTLDTTAAAGTKYTSCVGYKGFLLVASRSTSFIDSVAILRKNNVTGTLTAALVALGSGADDSIYRFVTDDANSVILAYRTNLSDAASVYKSITGASGWAQEVNLVTTLSIDPTALVGQGGVFDDHQYFAYVGSSGFLIKRTEGVYTAVHAGPIGLGMAAISSPTPPSTERPFSFIQAGDKIYGLTLSGDFSREITLPSGVTIDGTKRVRVTILARKIIVAGSPGISEPIWVYPKTLVGYKLRQGTPDPPTLTGGAAGSLVYGWVSFIQKLDGFLVNESPLSDASTQSTSKIFTNIDTPAGGTDWTGRRLYRSLANGTIPFQAVDIDDITTTSFDTNSITDAALALAPSDPELGEAPSDMDIITSWRNRVWARSNTDGQQDNAYFSAVGNYYAWDPDNFLPAQPLGEDVFGITGWLPRRDELVIAKRARMMKVVGTGIDGDFDVIVVTDGIGCVSPDSCIVIRDVGYFLGVDGPYTYGPQGVESIFDRRVVPWFQTDSYFNRSMFPFAVGGYNPVNDTYDLHLASVGSSVLDRYVSYDIGRREWLGPHKTDKFTTYGRGLLRDEDGGYQPSMGGNDGFVYKMNQLGASDEGVAIVTDWILSWLSGAAPDITHNYLQATIFVRIEVGSTGRLIVTPRVGALDAPDGTPQEIPLDIDRTLMARFGTGRLLRLQFQHSEDGEDLLLEAMEIPYNEVARR